MAVQLAASALEKSVQAEALVKMGEQLAAAEDHAGAA